MRSILVRRSFTERYDPVRPYLHQHLPRYSSASSGSSDNSSPVSNGSNNNHREKISQHHDLLREVRRLRAENDYLRTSVNILKDDLRIERESRKITEECHQRFRDKVESEIAEFLDRIDRLTQHVEGAKASCPSCPAAAGDEEEEGGFPQERNDSKRRRIGGG